MGVVWQHKPGKRCQKEGAAGRLERMDGAIVGRPQGIQCGRRAVGKLQHKAVEHELSVGHWCDVFDLQRCGSFAAGGAFQGAAFAARPTKAVSGVAPSNPFSRSGVAGMPSERATLDHLDRVDCSRLKVLRRRKPEVPRPSRLG